LFIIPSADLSVWLKITSAATSRSRGTRTSVLTLWRVWCARGGTCKNKNRENIFVFWHYFFSIFHLCGQCNNNNNNPRRRRRRALGGWVRGWRGRSCFASPVKWQYHKIRVHLYRATLAVYRTEHNTHTHTYIYTPNIIYCIYVWYLFICIHIM